MDQQKILKLLTDLATDNDYRDRLIADPIGVMGAAGITITASDIPSGGIKLPSKEDIERNLEAWALEILQPKFPPQNNAPRIWLGLS